MENPAPTTLQYPQHALVRPTTLCETTKKYAKPSTPKHAQARPSTPKHAQASVCDKRLRQLKMCSTSPKVTMSEKILQHYTVIII